MYKYWPFQLLDSGLYLLRVCPTVGPHWPPLPVCRGWSHTWARVRCININPSSCWTALYLLRGCSDSWTLLSALPFMGRSDSGFLLVAQPFAFKGWSNSCWPPGQGPSPAVLLVLGCMCALLGVQLSDLGRPNGTTVWPNHKGSGVVWRGVAWPPLPVCRGRSNTWV